MKKAKRRAVFLDRDGTINVEVGYLNDPEELELIPGAAQAVARLNDAGFIVVVVSNQSGVARGYFTEEDVHAVNRRMVEVLGREGARIDGIYYCPHHPEFGDGEYRKDCGCRKPNTGMVKRAIDDLDIDISRSYVVGDHLGDVLLGVNAGARSIHVLTGHGITEREKLIEHGIATAYLARDLADAVEHILSHTTEEL
ncbi:MAG: D-glycero-beta-D-manno-heptose 1,7-bisphosphate 7-phosphatase [Deltaproteobacteria bacterium]|nr:D-glycero-beta-D-manno-heptose 1,7-bisphosphate 7-phosphatase [Candidatus Zymogenaceae bacterium]